MLILVQGKRKFTILTLKFTPIDYTFLLFTNLNKYFIYKSRLNYTVNDCANRRKINIYAKSFHLTLVVFQNCMRFLM